jgi:phosphate transport system substrate-binding protein
MISPVEFVGRGGGMRAKTARFWMLAVLATLLLSQAGCGENGLDATDSSVTTLRISGSGTCLPLAELLTEAYPEEGVEFSFLPGLHSSGGVAGVAQGDLEIGTVSRPLQPDEEVHGLDLTWLSSDGLAVAVHPSVAVDGLSTEEITGVYAGEYSNWAELGGEDMPIIVLDRNEDESAKIILREHVIGSIEITAGAIPLNYESDMVVALSSSPGAIGYFSLGMGVSQGARIRFISLDGVEPSTDSVAEGTYDMVRELGVVSSADAPSQVDRFLDWATGDEAAALMTENGYAPFAGR